MASPREPDGGSRWAVHRMLRAPLVQLKASPGETDGVVGSASYVLGCKVTDFDAQLMASPGEPKGGQLRNGSLFSRAAVNMQLFFLAPIFSAAKIFSGTLFPSELNPTRILQRLLRYVYLSGEPLRLRKRTLRDVNLSWVRLDPT